MKYVILLSLGLGLLSNAPNAPNSTIVKEKAQCLPAVEEENVSNTLSFQDEPGSSKMLAATFRAQKFCRAEVEPDFPFDVHFSIVNAKVYFSGTNFRGVDMGVLTSGSLEPIAEKMKRSAPGTIVVFDDVKVVGPDKTVRPIGGLTLMLH